MMHEAQTPEFQGLVQGLNASAQHAQQAIHQHQAAIEGRFTKNVSVLARFFNPNPHCNATKMFNCYERAQQTQPWVRRTWSTISSAKE